MRHPNLLSIFDIFSRGNLLFLLVCFIATCCLQGCNQQKVENKKHASLTGATVTIPSIAGDNTALKKVAIPATVKSQNNQQTESIKKAEQEDDMQAAMELEFLKTQDPALHTIPRERLAIAVQQVAASANTHQLRTSALSWSERGPSNIGGRTRAVLIDKNDVSGNTVFAGSVGGGIWKCSNFTTGAFTWAKVNDNMENLAITALAQNPTTSLIMYAGTGEGFFNSDAIKGGGIFKSIDGGANWTQLTNTIPSSINGDFDYIQDIVVTAAGIVYASARSQNFCNAGGILRSIDGGVSWTRVIGSQSIAGCANAIDFTGVDLEIAANGDLYATTGLFGTTAASYSHIFRSAASLGAVQGDPGQWTNITPTPPGADPGFDRIDVACAPSNNQFLYAICKAYNTDGIRRFYQSSNAGSSWTEIIPPTWCDQGSSNSDFTRSQAWYDLIVSIDPNTTNNIYVGGVDVMKSTTSGSSFTQLTQWASGCGVLPNVHADIHNIVFYPASSSNFIIVNDGGIYYTSDGGATFTAKNTGYNVTQYYAVAIHPTLTNYFIAGAQDNGTQKFTAAGVNAATTFTGGDGAFCHIGQTKPAIQITAFTFSNINVSRNGGASITNSISNTGGRFINPTAYDETAGILYRSTNAGSLGRITNIASGTLTSSLIAISQLGTTQISAITIDPNVSNTIWVGGSSSGLPVVVKIVNPQTASPTATDVSIPGVGNGWYISSLDVEKGNSNHLLATLSNYGVTSVWESTNGGTSWTAIEGDLPDIPVRWGMFLPSGSAEGVIMLATELGIFTTNTTSGGSINWIANSSGFPKVRTDMIKFRRADNTIIAATHGRGLFTSTLTITPNTWVGTVSNDWANAANWSANRVPTATDDVVIPTGANNLPVLVAAIQAVYNLTIQTGASINITGVLQAAGNLVNNASTIGTGSLTLNGTSSQGISGAGDIANLILNNENGAVINSVGTMQNITDVLTVTFGTLSTNNNLTIKSTSTRTARVAAVLGAITGKATVERAIGEPSAKRAWRLLTTPLRNGDASDASIYNFWQLSGATGPAGTGKGTLVTGPAANQAINGLDAISGASLKSFDGTSLVDVTNTKTTSLFGSAASAANIGYFLFVRGDRSSAALTNVTKTTLSATGTLQTGNQTFNTNTAVGGVTLLPNPYASPVDFDLFRQDNTGANIKPNFQFWDPNLNTVGGYITVTYDGGSSYTISPSGADRTRNIQSGQAVFVERSVSGAGTSTVVFKETQKVTNSTNNVFRTGPQLEKLAINLNAVNSDGSIFLADGIVAKYNQNYTGAIGDEDATKLINIDENIAFKRSGVALSVEGRSLIDNDDTLFLSLSNMKARDYQLVIDPTNFNALGLSAFLQDVYLGTSTAISLSGSTNIPISINSNAGSYATERFRIVFRGSTVLPLSLTNVKAYEKGTGIQVEWSAQNELNVNNYEVEKSANGSSFYKLALVNARNNGASLYSEFDATPLAGNNFYRIKSIANNGEVKYSKVVKVNIGKHNSEITIFPNPVKDKSFAIYFNNMEKGTYSVSLFNGLGAKVFSTSIIYNGGNASEALRLKQDLPKGVYQLKIMNGSNKVVRNLMIE
jgi:hypothetical protein